MSLIKYEYKGHNVRIRMIETSPGRWSGASETEGIELVTTSSLGIPVGSYIIVLDRLRAAVHAQIDRLATRRDG